MRKFILSAGAAFATTIGFANPASAAASLAACAVTDISPNAQACVGFLSGNLLSNSGANITAQQSALATLGFAWDGNFNAVEKIEGLNGSQTVNFATLLQGISYVAFHYGNGNGGPGNGTAFYRLNAGAGVDVINLAYNASSNAVLYSTTPNAVPEPATWAMMLGGLGLVGAAMRRRKTRMNVSFS